MVRIRTDLLEGVAASMRDRPETPSAGPSALEQKHAGRKRADNAAVIRLDRIDRDPNQPRAEFDAEDLGRLAESMRTRGQLQPIRVRWDDARRIYVVVLGERRWRAAAIAGLETLACIVLEGSPSAEELLEDQLVENCLRSDLKPIEQAKAFRRLLDGMGLSQRQLADRLHISQTSISQAIALLGLPESVQEKVDAGDLPPSTAYQISRAEPTEHERLARAATKGKAPRPRAWTHAVGKVRVSVSGTDSPDAIVDALKAALAAARKATKGEAA